MTTESQSKAQQINDNVVKANVITGERGTQAIDVIFSFFFFGLCFCYDRVLIT
jgi:hypothetical protein